MLFSRYLKIFLIVVTLLFSVPNVTQAVSWFPIVPCGLNQQPKNSSGVEIPKSVHDYTQPCNQCLLVELGKNMIDFTFFGIVPMVGTLFFLWAGFKILWGGKNGSPGAVTEGRKIMENTAIGIAIILSAWLITNMILKTLANDDRSDKWYKIDCRVGNLKDLTDVTIPRVQTPTPKPGSPTTPTGPTSPTGPSATCMFSGFNLCQGNSTTPYSQTAMVCSNSSCGQYAGYVAKYAGGAASANLIKAIMMKESSCNSDPPDSGAGAYGLMQMKPSTAKIYARDCDIHADITSGYLIRNPESSVCLAAAYIRALSQGQCGSQPRNLAAGYNAGPGWCSVSEDCASEKSCSNDPVKSWECLYNNPEHTACNTGLNQTRDHVTKVLYCMNNPGF